MHNPQTSPDPDHTVSQLGQSFAQAAQNGRALVEEMTVFAKDESLRFVNLRLERNGALLDRLQNCQGVPGLIGVQQDWLRDLVQDYAGQNMRLMGALRGLTRNVMESAAENAAENIDHVRHEAGEAMHQAGDAMDQAVQQIDQMGQENTNYIQSTQH
jgi:ElaB/YqjD/DUF883 family membrane-anchored ribosome-binding protein